MKRLSRTPRNVVIVAIILAVLWVPIALIEKLGETIADLANAIGTRLANAAVRVFETDADRRERELAARRRMAI